MVLWGTPDLGKPRTRILIGGLRSQNAIVAECICDVWGGVEDKSEVKSAGERLGVLIRYCLAYPILVFRYLRAPRHDAVMVAYMGHFDVLVLWPFAKLRGAKVVWDAFLSLYGTVVEDRKMIAAGRPLARLLHNLEKFACRAADVVILDTHAHADYFRNRYRLRPEKVISVWVGVETDIFDRRAVAAPPARKDDFSVLFYGQFIPLHGVEHIVDAARRTRDPSIKWTLIGQGQERAKIDALLSKLKLPSVRLIDWTDYTALPDMIARADLCLGIFGDSDKAARVIPNKVFQILAMGRPLATADTPAIREIVSKETPGVWLVPPGSGAALAESVAAAKRRRDEGGHELLYPGIEQQISPQAIARMFNDKLERALGGS